MNRKRIRELLWAGAILLGFVALMAVLSRLF